MESMVVLLRSSDGMQFEVEAAVAMVSERLKYIIEDECCCSSIGNGIFIPYIDGRTLAKVIDYCKKKHVINGNAAEEGEERQIEIDHADMGELYDLLLAAKYLCIKGLFDLCDRKLMEAVRSIVMIA